MASKILLPLLLLLAAASPAALAAFDALQMLADKPKYGTFSKLLAQTKVAEEAGQLRSASLLVVTDKAAKPLASLAADKLRPAVANHVLLNYFDPIKLDKMRTRTALLPTLLSTTDKRLGFVNYSRADDGQMYLGAPGAPCIAKLVKVVAARPYSVSIMEVSKPILPPGFGDPVPAPGRRAKGGKAKIKPSASGLDESKIAAPSQAAGATGEVFPDNPGFASVAPVAAPK